MQPVEERGCPPNGPFAGEYSVRFHFPEPDGLTLGKLRAMHIMSTRFWEKIGFGYERNGTGEGR